MGKGRSLGVGLVVVALALVAGASAITSGAIQEQDERPGADDVAVTSPSPLLVEGASPLSDPPTLEKQLTEADISRVQGQAVPVDELSGSSPLSVYEGIGPGSRLTIDIEGVGGTWCTANFIWEDLDERLYIGTAGHCVLPDEAIGTHGPHARFDPDRVTVHGPTNGCILENPGLSCPLTPQRHFELGDLVYARRGMGHDVALVELPDDLPSQYIRTEDPTWGGPDGSGRPLLPFLGFVGQAQTYGSTPATEDRLLVYALVSVFPDTWMAAGAVDFGDSGSGVLNVEPTENGRLQGEEAVGIATHSLHPPAGLVFGTLVEQAKWDMACYADLHVHVKPGGEALHPDDCT